MSARTPTTPPVIESEPALRPHPGGSICGANRWPEHIHADACWTTPKALCDIDAPIHPDDITTVDEKVTCPECRDVMEFG